MNSRSKDKYPNSSLSGFAGGAALLSAVLAEGGAFYFPEEQEGESEPSADKK